jgi:hypothetical protein
VKSTMIKRLNTLSSFEKLILGQGRFCLS